MVYPGQYDAWKKDTIRNEVFVAISYHMLNLILELFDAQGRHVSVTLILKVGSNSIARLESLGQGQV